MLDDTVPAPKLVLPEQPKTDVTSAVFNRPLPVGIGGGLEQLGAGAEDMATSLARQQAQSDLQTQKVTIDANGQVQMADPSNSIILGRAGDEYNQAMNVGNVAQLGNDVRTRLQNIQLQYPMDPVGFKKASDDYVSSVRSNTTLGPAVGNSLGNIAAAEAARRLDNVSEKSFELGAKVSLENVQTEIADTTNRMRAIARQGGINTPAYDQLQDLLQDSYDNLKSSGRIFGYSPERADSEFNNSLSMDRGEAIVGNVEHIFNRTSGDGGRAGAQQYLQQLDDPSLDLSIQERDNLKRLGLAHLEYLTSNQKAAIDASRVGSNAMLDLYRTDPTKITEQMFGQAMTQAHSVGDAESELKLQWAHDAAPTARALQGLTDEQRLVAQTGGGAAEPGASGRGLINAPYTRPVDQPTSSGLSPQAMYSYLLGKGATKNEALLLTGAAGSEGVYNPSALHDPNAQGVYQGYGLFGHNGARLDAMRQSAGSFTPTWQQQADFALGELRSRPEGAAANAATTADQLADAEMAYEQPRAYTAANPRAGENYTGRLNTIRFLSASLKDTPGLAPGGSGFSPGTAAAAPTSAQMQANPYALPMYIESLKREDDQDIKAARSVGGALDQQFSQGNIPPAETTAAYLQMADRHPNELGEQAQKVRNYYEVATAGAAINAMTDPAQREAYAAQVAGVLANPTDLNAMGRAEEVQRVMKKGDENLKADPWPEMVRRQWIARPPFPLDFTQPQTVPQALAERAQAAGALASFTGNAGTSMIAPAELPQLKSVMNGPLDQRTALVAAIGNSGASPGVMRATLGALAGDEQTLPLAVAAGVFRDSPETARGILQGQQILQQEPKFAPKAEAMTPELATAISPNDLPGEDVRGGIMAAARAVYAKMSFDANDTTGVINTDRMSQAIAAVTGGIRSYRGSSFIAPWYGATSYQTDAAIRALGDDDFKGAKTADGQPFSAAALKPSFSDSFTWNNWRLQSVGDGKYLVYSGSDTARQYLGAAGGGKFVLNLGAKRGQVEAAAASLPSQAPFSSLPAANMPFAGPM